MKLSQSLKKKKHRLNQLSPYHMKDNSIFPARCLEKKNNNNLQAAPGKREVLGIHENRRKIWVMQVGRSIWIPFPRERMLVSVLTAQPSAKLDHTFGGLATSS